MAGHVCMGELGGNFLPMVPFLRPGNPERQGSHPLEDRCRTASGRFRASPLRTNSSPVDSGVIASSSRHRAELLVKKALKVSTICQVQRNPRAG